MQSLLPIDDIKDPVEVSEAAGLVYITKDVPGISRKKKGKGYAYYHPSGELVKNAQIKHRANGLAIPPAYTNVWISPLRNSHLQATGVDARGRTQYKYHPRWREFKNVINHARMVEFGQLLPKIRRRVQKDLNPENINLHRSQVLATVVRLLDTTLIRIGNEQYAKLNDTFGLTTIRKKHVEMEKGGKFLFEFQGKSHQEHTIEVNNPKLAKIVRASMEEPGYELFKYFDSEGNKHDLTSSDVNQYLQDITGRDISAKDFRTWWASVLTLMTLEKYGEGESEKTLKTNINKAIKYASSKLGNTPSVCRKYYVYPGLLDSYLQRTLSQIIQQFSEKYGPSGLSLEEKKVLYFLENHLKKETIPKVKSLGAV